MTQKKLIENLLNASNRIHSASINGTSANYIVTSPQFASILKSLDFKYVKEDRIRKIQKLWETWN